MPKSRNRKNHKTKVNNFKNKVQENRNNIKKYLNALQEINSGNAAVEPEYSYVSGNTVGLDPFVGPISATMLTPTPEITNTNYE